MIFSSEAASIISNWLCLASTSLSDFT
jgi:hypothetical protein